MLHENKLFKLFFPIFLMICAVTIFTGCASTQVKDPKECCHKLSLHNEEMGKFVRYCKHALYVKQSDLKDAKVMDIAQQGVRICKFVLGVEDDQQLLSINEPSDDMYKVRTYIFENDGQGFWPATLPCDPNEFSCEEF